MKSDENEARFLASVAASLEVPRDNVALDSTRDDLPKWDSLSNIMLLMALESEFGVHFSSEDIDSYRSLRQIYDRIFGDK